MSYLRLDGLTRRYGDTLAADAVSLEVAQGEMIVLLGPSGCGKTTTLRMIAGFVAASAGEIMLEGRSIGHLPPYLRDIGMVFQNYALFPHLSVARNIAFGLEMRGLGRAAREARVGEMLRLVKLEALAARLPRQLSGGQQQRVAIARALAIHPRLLLLDEPLSNLDAELRQEVGREIRLLQRDRNLTAIMVTHDQQEAMAMADRLVVMQAGRVQQIGRQEDLYERPATPFVARFIGNSNLLSGRVAESRFQTGDAVIALTGRYPASGAATLAVRPERITLAMPNLPGQAQGRVLLSAYLGPVVEHVVAISSQTQFVARAPSSGAARFAEGDAVSLAWPVTAETLFDAQDQPLASHPSERTTPNA